MNERACERFYEKLVQPHSFEMQSRRFLLEPFLCCLAHDATLGPTSFAEKMRTKTQAETKQMHAPLYSYIKLKTKKRLLFWGSSISAPCSFVEQASVASGGGGVLINNCVVGSWGWGWEDVTGTGACGCVTLRIGDGRGHGGLQQARRPRSIGLSCIESFGASSHTHLLGL